MKKVTKLTATVIAGCMALGAFAGCTGTKEVFDNENDPLVFSTLELDRVFNPFFSTSATDSNIVGMTQIGMLANDEEGNVVYGDNESVIVKDREITTTYSDPTTKTDPIQTEYKFVLKNNVRFSNGSYLTIRDVLFNLYVYLDPVYTGSSTIYSTDIIGLKEYRTQSDDENEQDSFMKQYQVAAQTRIDYLLDAYDTIYEDANNQSINATEFKAKLAELVEENEELYGKNLVADFDKACALFKEELATDWSNSLNSYQDTVFTDKKGNPVRGKFTTDAEQFLYNEGFLSWSKQDENFDNSRIGSLEVVKEELIPSWKETYKDAEDPVREGAINLVYEATIPESLNEVIQYWATAGELFTFLTNDEMEKANEDVENEELKFPNISGIKFANKDQSVTVNGVTYNKPIYKSHTADDGTVTQVPDTNEVLSITIKKIDPKAIWNFAFPVAPMYYYSDAEHIAKFDYERNFGVEYRSQTFMQEVVNATSKVGVPVGAGPYAASKSSGGITNVGAGDFYDRGVVYYERNPYYVMGEAKIKKVRYQVISQAQMTNALYTGAIDFIEPNAKPETITELRKHKGVEAKSVQTSGYGYIGINAGKVPALKVRQAIMHSIDTQETVNYYRGTAQPIYRSMSLSSWVSTMALNNKTSYYPYIGGPVPADLSVVNPDYKAFVNSKKYKAGQTMSLADQEEFIRGLVEEEGYTLNSAGVYARSNYGGDKLKYRFTIVGDETDHPAFQALWHAHEILNKWGFDIEVKTDHDGLLKLSSGSLTVWAAAWGSTIDPDMYQVYHKESTATSVLNWGYKQILLNAGGRYDREVQLVDQLSEKIEEGRTIDHEAGLAQKKNRAEIYAEALDLVMQLAVELPTYQRDDLFAYNTVKIDTSTFNKNVSAFKGLLADLHLISLNSAK